MIRQRNERIAMPPKRKLRKAALWAGGAVLLLVMLNVAAYYRVVSKAYVVLAIVDQNGATQLLRESRAAYVLPWPIPSHFNQPWLLGRMQSWFEPVHQLDRRLRLDFWKNDPPVPLPATPPPNWFDQFDRPAFNPDQLPTP